jgi:hypothetical protein
MLDPLTRRLATIQLPTAILLILAGVLDAAFALELVAEEWTMWLLAAAAALGIPRPSELCHTCRQLPAAS